jgi:hypothetical protein
MFISITLIFLNIFFIKKKINIDYYEELKLKNYQILFFSRF